MRYIILSSTKFQEILARNVIFSSRTEQFLKNLEENSNKEQVKKFIKSNLRNWLINEYKGRKHKVKPNDPEWVNKALERGDTIYDISISTNDKKLFSDCLDYLNNFDHSEKLYKISVPDLIVKVKKWREDKLTESPNITTLVKYNSGFLERVTF